MLMCSLNCCVACPINPPNVHLNFLVSMCIAGESIPIRLFLNGYDLTPTMRDVNKKFSVRYYLNLVLIDDEDRRYFKQQVTVFCIVVQFHLFD